MISLMRGINLAGSILFTSLLCITRAERTPHTLLHCRLLAARARPSPERFMHRVAASKLAVGGNRGWARRLWPDALHAARGAGGARDCLDRSRLEQPALLRLSGGVVVPHDAPLLLEPLHAQATALGRIVHSGHHVVPNLGGVELERD